MLLSVCEPLCVIPYYLRTIRLYVIYKAQDFLFKKQKKPVGWFKYIKERTLIRINLAIAAILALVTIALYLGYALGDSQVFLYLPAYNVQVCYSSSTDLHGITLHSNISVTLIMLVHTLQCLLLLYSIHKLRHIKDDFSIKRELFGVLATWFLTSYLATSVFVYSDGQKWEYLTFLLVARSFTVALITGVKPLYQSYLNQSFILLPPSLGSIDSLDMVLVIPIASDFFFDYLDSKVTDPEAPILFSLYAEIRQYDKYCAEDAHPDTLYAHALAINQEYLSPDGQFALTI